jgi:hypothetical protein
MSPSTKGAGAASPGAERPGSPLAALGASRGGRAACVELQPAYARSSPVATLCSYWRWKLPCERFTIGETRTGSDDIGESRLLASCFPSWAQADE